MCIRTRSVASAVLILAIVLVLCACRGEGTNGENASADGTVDLLFVQNASGVSLSDGTLTMTGVSPATIYFSDRPERIAGHIETRTFTQKWGEGDDSFAEDPPNAALSLVGDTATEDVVVELSNPRLDGTTLTYDVKVLQGDAAVQGRTCALFIDVFGRPLTPISAAGVTRRVVRRNVRRR